MQKFERIQEPHPNNPYVPWPRSRNYHSSTVISGTLSDNTKKHYLVVLGGMLSDNDIVSDCWIMDIEGKTWKLVIVDFSIIMVYFL